jgi:signal peptidase I
MNSRTLPPDHPLQSRLAGAAGRRGSHRRDQWPPSPAPAGLDRWMNTPRSVLFVIVSLLLCVGCRKSVQLSGGMEPTIKAGEQVTINYLAYASSTPNRWDVVALEPPVPSNIVVLKRIIALPLETISLTPAGIVVNGASCDQRLARLTRGQQINGNTAITTSKKHSAFA